ncbi:hypothetical protein [Sorangium sp. So ce124]|uniref:hypothetical protein n=1 Tax=Sorangium sp. So ce124 TaxID=3133280 RepID=UPI003F5E580A
MRADVLRGRTPGRPGRAKLSGRSERSIPWKVGATGARRALGGRGEAPVAGNTANGDGCSSTCHVEGD